MRSEKWAYLKPQSRALGVAPFGTVTVNSPLGPSEWDYPVLGSTTPKEATLDPS